MSIQLLDNNASSVNFSSKHKRKNNSVMDSRARATAFVNMSDDQLKSLAYLTSIDSKREKKHKQSLVSTLYALPVVDIASAAILAKAKSGAPASLSGRLLQSSKRARGWVGALLVLGACTAAKNKLTAKSDSYNEFQNNHPGAAFILDLGTFAGLLVLGKKAGKVMVSKIKTVKPGLLFRSLRRVVSVNSKIDKGYLNTKILPNLESKANMVKTKAPSVSKLANFLVRNSVWVVLLAGLVKGSSHARKNRDKIEKNYKELKESQLAVAKHMTNVLGAERDVLAQGQEDLAHELGRSFDGKKPISSEEIAELENKKAEFENKKVVE